MGLSTRFFYVIIVNPIRFPFLTFYYQKHGDVHVLGCAQHAMGLQCKPEGFRSWIFHIYASEYLHLCYNNML